MRGSRFPRQHAPTPSTLPGSAVARKTPTAESGSQRPYAPKGAEAMLDIQAMHGNQTALRRLGQQNVQRKVEPSPDSSTNVTAPATPATTNQLSGKAWWSQFPHSVSTDDLDDPFKTNIKNFLQALTDAGATYDISSTYRPPERSFLMHYAWEIARNGMNPTKVPAYTGKGGPINIDWVHRDGAGKVDKAASKAAAEEMVTAYGMAFNAALVSNHNFKDAIDVTITWTGDLSIKDGNGKTVVIKTTPRNGADNTKLHAVGATYGVIKLVKDRPHWSRTGN